MIAREAFADDGGLERCALAMSDPRRPVHRVDGRAVDEALGVGVKLRAGDLLTGGEEVRQPLQWQQGFGYFQRGAVADHFHQGACLALCAQRFQSDQAKVADHQQSGGDDQRQGEAEAAAGGAQGMRARPEQADHRSEQ
ncbi:hypothetical protein D3C85_1543610 [compost metagenome]